MDATTGYFPGAIARPGPASALRAVLREALQGARLAGTLARSLHPAGAPRVVFLPSDGRRMSSLLRIYTLARALAAEGWACSVLPATLDLRSRRRALSWLKPDVVVMQGARHPLNRPSLYPGQRIIYDMDDADFHLEHLAAPVREAMGQVESVIAGSQYVADWCMAHGARADVVWTGTPVSRRPWRPQDRRGPVVAWAQSAPVDYVQERAFVAEVMTALVARHPGVRLRLYGRRPQDDDTILAPFRAAGIATEWLPQMRYARFLASLEDVSVGLSPVCPETPFSRGKSFGKILAYLDRGVPVIASDRVDHPRFFAPGTGILSNDPSVWVREADRLLGDPVARQTMAEDAHARFLDTFTPSVVARLVDPILRRALAPARADARSGESVSAARAA
jgi:hypothetical protein